MIFRWLRLILYKPYLFNVNKYGDLLRKCIIKNNVKLFISTINFIKDDYKKYSFKIDSIDYIFSRKLVRTEILDYILENTDLNEYDTYLLKKSIYNYDNLKMYHKISKCFIEKSENVKITIIKSLISAYNRHGRKKIEYKDEIYRLYNTDYIHSIMSVYLDDLVIESCFYNDFELIIYFINNLKVKLHEDTLRRILIKIININKLDIIKIIYKKIKNIKYNDNLLYSCINRNHKQIFDFFIDKYKNELSDESINNNLLLTIQFNDIYYFEKLLKIDKNPSMFKNKCLNYVINNIKNPYFIDLLLNHKYFKFENIDNVNEMIFILFENKNKYINIINKILNNEYILSKISLDVKNRYIPNYKPKKIKREYYE